MYEPFDLLTTSVGGSVQSCHVTQDESPITFASFLLSATERHPGNEVPGAKCRPTSEKIPPQLVQQKQLLDFRRLQGWMFHATKSPESTLN